MATRRLYFDDSFQDNFTAEVLSCEPLSETEDGGFGPRWGAVLDQTQLYPTSGGQPNDLGKLGEANVLDVLDGEEKIVHIVDRPLPPGRVSGCIDWPRRFDHMQQHTGQHLLSAVFHERFGLETVSFHLGDTVATIDLRGPQPSALVLEGAARAANAVIFDDREITVRYGTAEQFAEQGVRRQVDRQGILRAIEITGIDLQPCGGTHLRRTGQLGLILIRGLAKIRQDWRVEFVCGRRAESAARTDAAMIRQIATTLKCAPADLTVAVDRLVRDKACAEQQVKASLPRLAEAEVREILEEMRTGDSSSRVVPRVLDGVSAEYLQFLATALCRHENVVALLGDRNSGNLLFARNGHSDGDANLLLKQVFAKFPGKGGGNQEFARGCLADAAHTLEAITLAGQMLR
jgi:alanyl-tRNA synthetase